MSAPSHHLGVDVFVGTFGSPDLVARPGFDQPIGAPLVVWVPSLAQADDFVRAGATRLARNPADQPRAKYGTQAPSMSERHG